MQDFEKLGVFYLGREFDLESKRRAERLLLYDSKDLVTHAVCVGMTGSGKTGLCIGLLEEAAIDGIPAIIIDPKGDLANLLLTFPNLEPQDFQPWINPDDAAKKEIGVEEFAAHEAEKWSKGLADWGQSGARIQKLKDAADVVVYTPGSTAGIPVSILKSFQAPAQEVIDDTEAFSGRINTTATCLLSLLGVEADPLKSREHILISTILAHSWKNRQDVDLASLIQQIQNPPVQKVGILNIDSFYPAKDRMELSMAINNLLAAPSFSSWLDGTPLDIGQMLHSESGRPRHSIFSIAHLNDSERMFFVTLILNETLSWMRTQKGTTSLRAVLYMDEIFGYFPPVANPPSKLPLLTLLKQARAYGLGIVLATQNPVDLDYKGLGNTGTWFIGRLQTERDKSRVIEGLEGASASQGKAFDRQKSEEMLGRLGSRIFLMNNVHEDVPAVFETRWTLSYLAGPLTRSQIKALTDPVRRAANPSASGVPPRAKPATKVAGAGSPARPIVPADVPQYYVPVRGRASGEQLLILVPMLYGAGEVLMSDGKTGIQTALNVHALCTVTDDAVPVNWDDAEISELEPDELEKESSEPSAVFADVPAIATKPKSYDTWSKDFANWLYRNQTLTVFKSPSSKLCSAVGESEREFRVRLQEANRESRDRDVEELRKKYAVRINSLQERLRRAEQAHEVQTQQAKDASMQTAISFGTTLLAGLLGRKAVSAGTLGRATTAARGVSRSMKESADVERAGQNVELVAQQLKDLNAELEAEISRLTSASDPALEKLENVSIKPKKKDISVKFFGLVWLPHLQAPGGNPEPAW